VSPKINRAAWQNIDASSLARSVMAVDEQVLMESRSKSEQLYSWFANMTAIFPLLGILGTVISLLPMVADMENMQQNFFAALTSTLWGLIFAIAAKIADAPLAAKMEENDKELELLLARRPEIEEMESVTV
ncbi:MAG: MotA/TolQ/ExbB proton channel family protein, partial [Victivallales bacterium]|nr:MotA/TolQ/ExbB proton channel family protein [Victivallales bacterium]